ncbi:MAG TPA: PLP-dependent aminotransferase family protein [Solirubrobacteraceae bacterium]|nr:PLP-dependent aminotransferase family protein [Solirubrobacteraceae bacterium]
MDIHLALNRAQPLRAQLERELRAAIRSGRLRAGVRVPPSRALADELDLSRGVVVEAYSQLVAEGYLVARPGDGTRVAAGLAQEPSGPGTRSPALPRIRYDLRSGVPDLAFFPRRAWQSATATALRELPDAALSYGSRRGARRLRTALADYLGRVRAVVADPERLFVSAGAVHGIGVLCHALRERGARRIAIEDPAWRAIAEVIAQAGLEVVPVMVDDDGLDVGALESTGADAVVLSPAHQYPTGAVLAPERRSRLIAWARRRGALIIEDDYDAEYRYDREPTAALQGLAPDCVAYVGTASKTLAPAMRLGWLLVPGRLVDDMAVQHGAARAMPGAIPQAAYATLLERGEIDRHLRRTRREYQARRSALIRALVDHLPQASVGGAAAGLHLIAWLPGDADESAIAAAAAARGVAIHPLREPCSVTAARPPALLLGYGLISAATIPHAVEQVGRAAGRPPR